MSEVNIKRVHYPSGNIMRETPYKNNKKHGTEKWWWGNRQIEYEIQYQNGQVHGVKKRWYESGRLMKKVSYQNNKLHGIMERWYEDGQLDYKEYWLYGESITEEEYRKHELVEKLSNLKAPETNNV